MTTRYRMEATERHRRQRAAEAIALAMKSQWEQAIRANQEILELFPTDIEACNRLGKAFVELGRFSEAREAYHQALELDPHNNIARRNLERLNRASPPEGFSPTLRAVISSDLFIEETGKTAQTPLQHLAPTEVLSKVTPGSPVLLKMVARDLVVTTSTGGVLGTVPPPLGLRLLKLMEGGNRYSAAITSLREDRVTIIIKETYRHPSQTGKLSFPTRAPTSFRADIRRSLLDYGTAAETGEEETEEGDLWEESGEEFRMVRREQLIEEEAEEEEEPEE